MFCTVRGQPARRMHWLGGTGLGRENPVWLHVFTGTFCRKVLSRVEVTRWAGSRHSEVKY